MFSVKQKREISDKIQNILRETNHPELPEGEIKFSIHVDGSESWSWADIKNNGQVENPSINPWNEQQAKLDDIQIKKGNVVIKPDGNKYIAMEDHTATGDYKISADRPHGDEDFSYMCGRDYCRCMQ